MAELYEDDLLNESINADFVDDEDSNDNFGLDLDRINLDTNENSNESSHPYQELELVSVRDNSLSQYGYERDNSKTFIHL